MRSWPIPLQIETYIAGKYLEFQRASIKLCWSGTISCFKNAINVKSEFSLAREEYTGTSSISILLTYIPSTLCTYKLFNFSNASKGSLSYQSSGQTSCFRLIWVCGAVHPYLILVAPQGSVSPESCVARLGAPDSSLFKINPLKIL